MISDETSKEKENQILEKCEWIILTVPIDKTSQVINSIKIEIYSKILVFSYPRFLESGVNYQILNPDAIKIIINFITEFLYKNAHFRCYLFLKTILYNSIQFDSVLLIRKL